MSPYGTAVARHAHRALGACLTAVEAVAFWAAALFPVVHVLVLATGGYGDSITAVLPWLVAGHALAVVVGYRYEPSEWCSPNDRRQGVEA